MMFSIVKAQDIPAWKMSDLDTALKTDQPTIINFWATFCKPCIEELPYYQELAKKYEKQGLKLILVSLDLKEAYPEKLIAFAKKRKVTAPIVFLDETNADLFCPAVDPSWSGAIPASIFLNGKTGYRKFFEAQLTKAQLEKEIKALLEIQ
jgi:thiol-disulfide isomerase/thioredoxin